MFRNTGFTKKAGGAPKTGEESGKGGMGRFFTGGQPSGSQGKGGRKAARKMMRKDVGYWVTKASLWALKTSRSSSPRALATTHMPTVSPVTFMVVETRSMRK